MVNTVSTNKSNSVRVRFAPSPTGYLHVGGARTALFNWLFARQNKGTFILRIEDTDKTRSTPEALSAIIESLNWLRLTYDEGPYYQSQRLELYKKFIDRLLKEGKAYYCFCSPELLQQKREAALAAKIAPKYDGTCANLSKKEVERRLAAGEKAAVRFRKLPGITEVNDLVRGKVVFDNEIIDDFIILRSDGMPTYNFTVVVDDIDMGITHVIRGEEHLSNTPKQLMLYSALGYQPPKFAHLSMILAPDKSKLSKRHGATSVLEFRDLGYLPEAMLNYLALLGWAYDDKTEFFTIDELIEKFSLEKVSKNPAIFDHKKLEWMNSVYLRKVAVDRLEELLIPILLTRGYAVDKLDKNWVKTAIELERIRAHTLLDIANNFRYYLDETIEIDEQAAEKYLKSEKSISLLSKLISELAELDSFDTASLETLFKRITATEQVKLADLVHPTRVALTGKTVGPGIYELISVMGKETAIKRIKDAINRYKSTVYSGEQQPA